MPGALFLCFFLFYSTAVSEMLPVIKSRAGIPPHEVIEELIRSNSAASRHDGPRAQTSKPFITPYLTWVTDSDPRLQPDMIMGSNAPTIFSVRTLSGMLDDVLGSVDFGVNHLHAPVLLITVNSDSYGLRLYMRGHALMGENIRENLEEYSMALERPKQTDIRYSGQWKKNLDLLVDHQVALAMERYRARVDNGRLVIVGSILDLANIFGKGGNKLLIVNVNGETESAKIRELPFFVRLDQDLIDVHVLDRSRYQELR